MKNQVASVNFNNHSLIVVTKNEQRLVAMRPVCDGIGLDWKAQYNRIKRDEILNEAMVIMTIPSKGGEQSTACLPLEYLNGWLFGIDVSRCREEIRPALIQYKRECYQVLANYWQTPVTETRALPSPPNKRAARRYKRAGQVLRYRPTTKQAGQGSNHLLVSVEVEVRLFIQRD